MNERFDFSDTDVTKDEVATYIERAHEEVEKMREKIIRTDEKIQLGTALLERSREAIAKITALQRKYPDDSALEERLHKLSERYAQIQEVHATHQNVKTRQEQLISELGEDFDDFSEFLKSNLDS